MNRKILFFALLGIFNLQANAQSNPKNPIVTGVKIGGNLSNISAGNNSQEIKPGFHAGGFVEFPLSYYKKFALQLELMYSNQGYNGKKYEVRDNITGKVVETNKLANVTLHYLNIPVVFKYYLKNNFTLEIGPQIGFLMDAHGEFDLYKFNPARSYLYQDANKLDKELLDNGYRSKNYKNYYEKLDYGISAGVSYIFDNGIFISGKYYLGLQDIYKADNGYSKILILDGYSKDKVDRINQINKDLDLKAAKNSVFQVSVGYQF